jgi:hypothetical protein
MSVIDELNCNSWKRELVRRLLIQGRERILEQGEVSMGWGNENRTCAVGALAPPDKVPHIYWNYGDATEEHRMARRVLDQAAREIEPSRAVTGISATFVSDMLGYKAVLKMYDKAIKLVTPAPKRLRLKALIIKRKGA